MVDTSNIIGSTGANSLSRAGATPNTTLSSSRALQATNLESVAGRSSASEKEELTSAGNLPADVNLSQLESIAMSIDIDHNSGQPIVTIFDKVTGEKLLQIPGEHSLTIAKTIETLKGKIFDRIT